MPRYYGPRRTKRAPPSKTPDSFDKLVMWSIGVVGVGGFVFVIGCMLYAVVTEGLPRAYAAVVDWGHDVVTVISEHHWQFTDGVLYVGIAAILIFRYSNFFKTPE
jgi:hypothetical protein